MAYQQQGYPGGHQSYSGGAGGHHPYQQMSPIAPPGSAPHMSYGATSTVSLMTAPSSSAASLSVAGSASQRTTVSGSYTGPNKWNTALCTSWLDDPVSCCSGFFCPWCCVVDQRKRLLMGDMNKYSCCLGNNEEWWAKYVLNSVDPDWIQKLNTQAKGNEECALCMEACFCLNCAIRTNRFMVMEHYNLEWDCGDKTLFRVGCLFAFLGCCQTNPAFGCILAQHDYQMKTQGYPVGTFPSLMS